MLKGFHIGPGLVDDVPLNIIRCQQLVEQKPMLLQQLFRRVKEVFVRIIEYDSATVRTNSSGQ